MQGWARPTTNLFQIILNSSIQLSVDSELIFFKIMSAS